LWPSVRGRDHHADTGDGYQVARPGQPGVGSRCGLPCDAESLGQLVARLDCLSRRPLPGPDLSLDDPRYLEVSRDPRQVVKIIRHTGHPS
jgi:hypothetical protein